MNGGNSTVFALVASRIGADGGSRRKARGLDQRQGHGAMERWRKVGRRQFGHGQPAQAASNAWDLHGYDNGFPGKCCGRRLMVFSQRQNRAAKLVTLPLTTAIHA